MKALVIETNLRPARVGNDDAHTRRSAVAEGDHIAIRTDELHEANEIRNSTPRRSNKGQISNQLLAKPGAPISLRHFHVRLPDLRPQQRVGSWPINAEMALASASRNLSRKAEKVRRCRPGFEHEHRTRVATIPRRLRRTIRNSQRLIDGTVTTTMIGSQPRIHTTRIDHASGERRDRTQHGVNNVTLVRLQLTDRHWRIRTTANHKMSNVMIL